MNLLSQLCSKTIRLLIGACIAIAADTTVNGQCELKNLLPSDAAAGDFFGRVSISGDLAIVGASGNDDAGEASGSAYIFHRNLDGADNWGEVKKLTASDAAAGDGFGFSVSISGDVAVVGVPGSDPCPKDPNCNFGSAYIFYRNHGGADNWGEVKKITASDAAASDSFGHSVSISGDYAIVGAWGNDDAGGGSGSAYIFGRNHGGTDNWGEVKKLTASDAAANDQFGWLSISISGDFAIVGAWHNDDAGQDSGSAYIFGRNHGGADNWGEVKKLTASDAAAFDLFGQSVSISGDFAIVGAHADDDGGQVSGSAYIFHRNQGGTDNWGEMKKLTDSDASSDDWFGMGVSISGDRAIVGAHRTNEAGSQTGSAYIFHRNLGGADNWGEMKKIIASDAAAGDIFGRSVSIDGDVFIIGAENNDDAGINSGSAYVFDFAGVDCNTNGVPDNCDISEGTSLDVNGNLVPDECEVDCNGNFVPDSLDIQNGTSQDCNKNLVPDECDIAVERSSDCDNNGIPDECEADCNLNGIADGCDIASAFSCDRNANSIPDECESYCLADVTCSGIVNVDDLLRLIGSWGPCQLCPADLNGDGVVNVDDLLLLIGSWGPCP